MSKLVAEMNTIEYAVKVTDKDFEALADKTSAYYTINPELAESIGEFGAWDIDIDSHNPNYISFFIQADDQQQIPYILEEIENFLKEQE